MLLLFQTGMAGASNVEATDSETNASLLNPECGIPFDVHFDIEDNDGNNLGMLGGHKNIMALKSPVFKAMLFGPMKETSDRIKVKDTSVLAFETILRYIHDVELEWWPWSIDVAELVRIVDLAQRFHLPGLKEKTEVHARDVYLFPKERLLEIARVAEENQVYPELSESLLDNCEGFLYAIIETPKDFDDLFKDWSEKSPEEASIALRLLARLKHEAITYNVNISQTLQEIMSDGLNINRSIQPRYRLQKIKTAIENSESQSMQNILKRIGTGDIADKVLPRSFWMCQKMDAEKAAQEGIPLKLDTLVEEHFTHQMSVKLHLDLIALLTRAQEGSKELINILWKELRRSIPEVKPIILAWFSENLKIFDKEARCSLARELRSCDDEWAMMGQILAEAEWLKKMP